MNDLVFTTVKLTSGIVVKVLPVPPFALAEVERHFVFADRLEGEEAEAAQSARALMVREAAWLMALPDVEVPEDWVFPRGLRYAGVQPREGEEGRLLDYIEYGLLLTSGDVQAVQATMYESSLTGEELGIAEATFQTDSGRETYPAYPTRSE